MGIRDSIRKFFQRSPKRMSDENLKNAYARAGAEFGDAVSYIYMGECIGFEELLSKWEVLEAEWAGRGFRTFPIEDFVSLGGYGVPIEDLGSRLGREEKAVLHALRYRETFLGKIQPALDLKRMMETGEPQEVRYIRPTTSDPSSDKEPG